MKDEMDRLNRAGTTVFLGALRFLIPGGTLVRKTLSLLAYSLFVDVVAWFLITSPVHAVTYSSTGYVRVVPQASQLAYLGANRAALLSTVAAAAASSSPASMAIRIVTGPVGWAALGVAAGLALMQLYYSQQDLQTIATAAAPPPGYSIPGYAMPAGGQVYPCGSGPAACSAGQNFTLTIPNPPAQQVPGVCITSAALPTGWSGWGAVAGFAGCIAYHASGNTASAPVPNPTSSPTQQQAATYLNQLPASDPNSLESHTTPLGQGASPSSASTTQVNPASTTDTATSVVPASQVKPTDVVVNPNAPPPAGTPTTQTQTQTDTSTTTTTTNPNGTVTTQTDTSTTSSCSAGDHDQRTMASVLQTHLDTWKGSGIAGQLALLQNLTWPTTYPTYSVQSSLFGTFSFDFSQWSGVLTALRTLIIAASSFVAYRIIFVGGK